jgi:hypothetical protein
MKRLAQEMLSSTLEAVEIGCDNQGTLNLLETGVVQEVKYHQTRDEVQNHIPAEENPSDSLTKALRPMKHAYLTGKLNLCTEQGISGEKGGAKRGWIK